MELLVTYMVTVGVILYLGYALISAIENAIENGLRGWLRASGPLLIGLGCAALGGTFAYYTFGSPDAYARWSIVLALAIACGALSTALGDYTRRMLDRTE